MNKWRRYKAEILIALFGFLCVNAIFAVNVIRGFSDKEGEYAEHFGSFIGGYVGSLFSLGAMLLLFLTLKAQRQSSEDQNFETKYFALLTLHRSNVAEMKVWTGEAGRRLFLLLLDEVRRALGVIQSLNARIDDPVNARKCLQAAYYVMFYGVGPNSTRMLLNAFDGLGIDEKFTHSIVAEVESIRSGQITGYVPFDGHQSRLGHYYRHLYQLVRYVDQQKTKSLDQTKKYEYVKTIRAQLSTHEQALLFLNSLTPMGHNWWDKDLIARYRLVKNIPRGFFDRDSEIDIDAFFPPNYFEWQEAGELAER